MASALMFRKFEDTAHFIPIFINTPINIMGFKDEYFEFTFIAR